MVGLDKKREGGLKPFKLKVSHLEPNDGLSITNCTFFYQGNGLVDRHLQDLQYFIGSKVLRSRL